MMKKLISISVMCMAALLVACGGKQQTAESQEAAEDDVTEAVVEEDATAEEAPTAEETVSPDYVMLNLKGKVKTFEIKGEVSYFDIIGTKVEFDKNGMIVQVEGDQPELERNDQGQIVVYSFIREWEEDCVERGFLRYTYDGNGQLANIQIETPMETWNNGFNYDENGNITEWIVKSSIDGNWKKKFAYQEFDDHGNWTKRTIDGASATRRLTYWE